MSEWTEPDKRGLKQLPGAAIQPSRSSPRDREIEIKNVSPFTRNRPPTVLQMSEKSRAIVRPRKPVRLRPILNPEF